MSGRTIRLRVTVAQAEALRFACSNTLAEPANFERGTGQERAEGPMLRALGKIDEALNNREPTRPL